MKQYEFDMRVTIRKACVVEAIDEEEATEKMKKWDTVDEVETDMEDWGIVRGPKELR